jgi:curved DNA-binding protein CbpA
MRYLVTREDIMSYFRRLAFQHHPDHGGDPAKFRELVEARDRALKRCRRTRVDRPRAPLKDRAEEAYRALMAIPLAVLLAPPPIPTRKTP